MFLKNPDNQRTAISAPKAFVAKETGTLTLRYEVADNNKNTSTKEVTLTVTSGMPIIDGLENLQSILSPMADIPVNLLQGVTARDAKNTDITSNIKVFVKSANDQYTLVVNPSAFTAESEGILSLRYQITDSYGQTLTTELNLQIAKFVLAVPQLELVPNDPSFDPNTPGLRDNPFVCKNWAEYLKPIKVLEVWAMGEAMVRSGTNDMSKTEYLAKLNRRQLALNNINGKPMGTDTEGQFIPPNTSFDYNHHEDGCNQILLGKKNNEVGGVGLAGPLIQQGGVNKAIRMEDGWTKPMSDGYNTTQPVIDRLQNNPDKYLIISSSANL